MNLQNVRRKPWLVDVLPGVGRGTCHAVYPNIYLARSVYKSVTSNEPDPYSEAVVIHEQEHLKRMKAYGVAKWYVRYLLSRKFRLAEELAASKPQLGHIKNKKLTFNLERKARVLSGWLYLWPASYESVLKNLNEAWESL